MASSGERRMVFDTRGKRKHVIRVVYAILALLMGASLFLVVGPVNIGAILGNSDSTGSATKVFHEQVERIEQRLAKDPTNEQILLALTRARINAGNSQIATVSETEVPTLTIEAKQDFDAASEAWSRYLKNAEKPSPAAAQLVGATFFRLAESSTSVPEAAEYVAKGTRAQRTAADQAPSVGSLSTLAIYQFYNGEYAAGEKTSKQAAAKAPSQAEAKNIEKQLAEYRKGSEAFQKQKKEVTKLESQASNESLQNPFSGLRGAPGG